MMHLAVSYIDCSLAFSGAGLPPCHDSSSRLTFPVVKHLKLWLILHQAKGGIMPVMISQSVCTSSVRFCNVTTMKV